jgi:hypothetical protein
MAGTGDHRKGRKRLRRKTWGRARPAPWATASSCRRRGRTTGSTVMATASRIQPTAATGCPRLPHTCSRAARPAGALRLQPLMGIRRPRPLNSHELPLPRPCRHPRAGGRAGSFAYWLALRLGRCRSRHLRFQRPLQWVYGQLGVATPGTAQAQYDWGTPSTSRRCSRATSSSTSTRIRRPNAFTHVGIYVGCGLVVMGPQAGDFVKEVAFNDPYWSSQFAGVGRPHAGGIQP